MRRGPDFRYSLSSGGKPHSPVQEPWPKAASNTDTDAEPTEIFRMTSSAGAFSSASVNRPFAAEQPSAIPQVERRFAAGVLAATGVMAIFFVLALALQWRTGAYRAQFSGYPDEPGHFTTGLMLRDYVAQGFPGNPVRYAENYYLHYPKVALGHWPPLFHILEAAWLLVFPVSWTSVMALMAVYCAIDAALLYAWVAPQFGTAAGFAVGALFLFVPLVRAQTAMVMAEGLLIIFVLAATFAWARFLETKSWKAAALFGVFASLGILVKGNGWALALVPPLSILFTRNLRLVKSWAFWLPVAIVALFCMPWQIVTAHLVEQGWSGNAGAAYFAFAIASFCQGLWMELTPPILLLAMAGIAATVTRRGGMAARPAAMLALVCGVLIFHSITPTGPEIRHVLAAFPALLTFVPAGVMAIAAVLKKRGFVILGRPIVLSAIAGLFFAAEAPAAAPLRSFGFEQAANYLTSRPELKDAVTLTSSDDLGEGLMIAETELREKRPGHYMLRATKLLARVDWSDLHYTALYRSTAAVRRELNEIPVDALIIDFTPGERPLLHQKQLIGMLAAHPAEWRLAGSFGATDGDVRPVRIYVRRASHGGADHLKSILADELHRIEEQ